MYNIAQDFDVDKKYINWLVDLLRTQDEIDIDLNDCLMGNWQTICLMSGGKVFPHHFTEWDSPLLAEALGMSYQDTMAWAYNNPALQMMSQPNPGAVEAIIALRQAGIRINIVTSTCLSASQIIAWLDEHDIPFDTIVKTKEKLGCNLQIDDSPTTLRQRMVLDLPTLKFSQLWNKDVKCPEIPSWQAVTTAVDQLQ